MQEKIIEILSSSDEYVSGQQLSDYLGVTRQAVWKSINSLREKGYGIDSVTNKGYRLSSFPAYLNVGEIKRNLDTKIIGQNLAVLDTVDSTNTYLKKLGSEGCKNGTVVASREQTSGKGRLGRVWVSKKDGCLTFSFLLRPNVTLSGISAITPLCGLAVCKAIRDFTKLDCMIKWPNDIIVGNKKLAGILTEISAEFDSVEYTVTGIGINTGQAVFDEDIAYKATSILLETGRHINNSEFLAVVLNYLEKELVSNNLTLTSQALEEYSSMCATVGRNVTFSRGTRKINGVAIGIDNEGELKVMLSDGSLCNVNSGEVTVQGIY